MERRIFLAAGGVLACDGMLFAQASASPELDTKDADPNEWAALLAFNLLTSAAAEFKDPLYALAGLRAREFSSYALPESNACQAAFSWHPVGPNTRRALTLQCQVKRALELSVSIQVGPKTVDTVSPRGRQTSVLLTSENSFECWGIDRKNKRGRFRYTKKHVLALAGVYKIGIRNTFAKPIVINLSYAV